MVCDLPFIRDCGVVFFSVPLQRDFQTQTIMAKIYVNGDAQVVSLPLNVSELIQRQNVLQPEMVSVQVNEEFAEREDWERIQLKEGDKVDFLYFMGGGSTAYGLIDN